MKQVLTLLVALCVSLSAQAVTTALHPQDFIADQPELATLTAAHDFDAEAFLDLTPKKVREMTGERLGIKGAVALKAAQKAYKKAQRKQGRDADVPKGLYVVGTLFGFAWLLMGLMDDFEGNNWWINLVLGLVTCGLGSLIHGFIKMKEYY